MSAARPPASLRGPSHAKGGASAGLRRFAAGRIPVRERTGPLLPANAASRGARPLLPEGGGEAAHAASLGGVAPCAALPTPDLVLGFDDYDAPAARFAEAIGVRYATIAVHHFPDGESRVTLPVPLPASVAMCRSLHCPNGKLVETILAAEAARHNGASFVSLVAPYLCYMRQDIAFHPGEAVSQRIVGGWLADRFDAVVTVDPHLHRVATLAEAVPAKAAIALSAAASFGSFLRGREPDALLVGPDEESAQWLAAAARGHRFDTVVGRKARRGDRDVEVELPAGRLEGRAAVLVDDMASTGATLAIAARRCLEHGARSVDVLVVHGLFVGEAVGELRHAGVRHVWSTDSVPHPTNALALAPLLAGAFRGAVSPG